MSRSTNKGPYIDANLLKKIAKGVTGPIKTWARSSQVAPEFVGKTFSVHNGKKFIDVYITEDMVGYKLGEFAPTCNFRGHAGTKK